MPILPVASSGIAALLLPNGRTAHSRFNIPLKLSEDKLCNIKHGTMVADLIEKTDLIIWDEAPMTHKHAFEEEKEFSDWLLQVGEGHPHLESGYECDNHHEQMISVDKLLIRVSGDDSLKEVVDAAYGDISKMTNPQTSYTDKAILTPRNETVDEINAYTISQTDGDYPRTSSL
ncbi:uncharacterized protein LOC106362493 [Brassica napus]|uniref:uncharacterized protein LOC106362493 n=1 Tax=Brassica napus TaxID=3708 RepID=UPI00207A0E55|nr:uncharacterized protein LOC106362493 [Brassica napus]